MTGSATPTPDARPGYRQTLNLPQTAFPMKANLVQNEPESIRRWAAMGLYRRLRERSAAEGRPRWHFHDGPPYANGSLHLGHILNKSLKDFVVRSRSMMGLDVPYVPGWDCHGLPIEHQVMTNLVESGKAARLAELDDDRRKIAVRRDCRTHAEKFIKLQSGQMVRLLTLADYGRPYLTMDPAFEGATLEVLADLVEQGLVYRALKPVHWSIANETALAEAELEYEDREDPSIYVDFEAEDGDAVLNAFGFCAPAPASVGFMIWTTTPWTLPANLAIAVHPRFEYALVEVDGRTTVIAAALVERVTKAAKAGSVRTLATTTGERLLGLRYRHPFVPNAEGAGAERHGTGVPSVPARFTVVPAEYVTLEDGTGLVHTAPGHGAEDFATGRREGLPVYCPVRHDGTYDDTVPEWLRGVDIWKANDLIITNLRTSARLFHVERITHSYPHDWRSKTPVIFRCTEQWFVGVDTPTRRERRTLRDLALDATAESVAFVPEWGRNRMRGMLESRPDWCISRQRSWGLPIPAFFLADGSVLLTAASVRAVAKLVREKGSDVWFTSGPDGLLRYYDAAGDTDAPESVRRDPSLLRSARKGPDILDVWFESGSTWNGVMREREGRDAVPVELYLEGSDQHRGWFQSSLLAALGATGRPPYKAILTHGFMVDKDGRKLSKSKGHTVDDLFKLFGADVVRWWASSLAYEQDMKTDDEFFRLAGESYRKVRNTIRFMLSNLYDFTTGQAEAGGTPDPLGLDAWALAEYDDLERRVIAAYERYDFRAAHMAIYDFCNDAMSAVYLAAVKDRLYCDRPDSPRRRATQAALWRITDGLCRLIAPILCHTADEAWRALHGAGADDADRCVHLETFASVAHRGSMRTERDPRWAKVMATREAALAAVERAKTNLGVENPLDAGVTLPDPDGSLAAFDTRDLADLLGVSRVMLDPKAAAPTVHDLRSDPRCERSWKRDGTVRQRSDGGWLSDRDAEAVGVA